MKTSAALALALLCATAAGAPALAQTPPSAAESAHYSGVFAAAQRGDLATLDRLLLAGADLKARDTQGRTALHVATFARQRAAMRRLVAAGVALDAQEQAGYDAVCIAAVADDEESLALLLSLGASPRQITRRYGGTALIAAAHLGHAGVVRQLIAAGAPLDHVNNLHWTAAIEAVVLGDGGPRHQQTLAALIEAGANLRLTDRQGNTPLDLAKARGYGAMVEMLERGR